VSRVEIEIPPNPVFAGVARLAVAALARSAGMDEERVEELKIAAGEACANAMLANEDTQAPVMLSWQESAEALILEVKDRSTSGSSSDDRMALSVALLETLVDDYERHPTDDGGMCARLSFHRG
jgi:anti-sigma regulatory factor (Ser/Thr protein kinase)